VHPAAHIKGTTRLYGLVGDPLTAAKSPELLNQFFFEQRVDAVCVPFRVEAEDLSAFVTGARAMRNLSGVLVTMPHKQRMMAFVDDLHPTARQVGALNEHDVALAELRQPVRDRAAADAAADHHDPRALSHPSASLKAGSAAVARRRSKCEPA